MRPGVSHVLIAVLLVGFLLPPFYVASAGPAIWCRDRGILTQHTLVNIYGPLDRLTRVPVVGRAVLWYLQQWYDRKLHEENVRP